MNYKKYVHRYADIILNSDYELRQDVEQILNSVSYIRTGAPGKKLEK